MSDLQNLIAAIDRNTAAVTALAAACSGTVEEKAKRGRPAKTAETAQNGPAPAATSAAAPAAQVAQPAQNGPAPASAASAAGGTGPSLQKVADAIIDLANTTGREAAVSILKKYGAEKVPQLKPADYAAALADVAVLKADGTLGGAGAGLM